MKNEKEEAMKDEVLSELLKTDAEHGMRLVMKRYTGIVHAVIRRHLSPAFSSDIEDVVADTFCEFYQTLSRWDPSRGSIKAYLCTIARHNAIDFLRHRQAPPLPLDEALLTEDGAFFDAGPDEALFKKVLIEAILSLDKTDRDIVMRKYYLGESTKEIASSLGMTVSAIDTRAHRAIQKLRKQFGGDFS